MNGWDRSRRGRNYFCFVRSFLAHDRKTYLAEANYKIACAGFAPIKPNIFIANRDNADREPVILRAEDLAYHF